MMQRNLREFRPDLAAEASDISGTTPMKSVSVIALTLALAGMAVPARAAVPEKPNIVFVFIDDMGYGDIGPFGSTKNRTPHLDRMAEEGMRFTSFYAAPVCSVSRAQVITGCYGQRVSLPGVLFPGNRNGINPEEHTVAKLLKGRGYATMCVGKWHLGDQPEFLPTRHGFDHYFGIPYSNDMMSRVDGRAVVPLVRDGKLIEQLTGDDQDRITERYTEEAVAFIRENQNHPFFLYLPHTAVHVPIHVGERFRGKSQNGRYGDWVEEVDWSVGRVLDTLRELKLGTRTLVIFSSDNGPWLSKGADGGEAGPLRGGKGSTFEGGVRVPTIAWWPGTVEPGTTCDAVAGNIDLLPTFVALAGGSTPADRKIDGRDFSPLLLGTSTESLREAHFYYQGYKLEAVRRGPWKLALGPQSEGMGQGKGSPDAAAPGVRLYNLDEEIGEQTNVAAEHPEVVERLQTLAAQMAADLGDGNRGPGVRPAGQVEHPVLLIPGAEPRKPGNRKPARPVTLLENLKIGDTFGGDAAPWVVEEPIQITCQVEPKAEGVLVAHGGSAVGYTLYVKDSRLVFAVRRSSDDITRITSGELPAGRVAIEARLAGDGTMTLSVDGKPAATGKAGGLLDRQPAEAFCVGHDDQMPLDPYDGKSAFAGSIEQLKVVTGEQP
jgi:arylsulfatase A